MSPVHPLHGLVAATHTPFHPDGSLRLEAIEAQAAHLLKSGVHLVFVCGTTGESSALTVEERCAITQRWCDVARGTELRVVAHVGSNCLADARFLATQAQRAGVLAVSALAPSYFKPRSIDDLVACCLEIASAVPELPFYYYDIPGMTGVALAMPEFLARAMEVIPNFAGVKFTNPDLMAYLQCLQLHGGSADLPWGIDEWMLGALATGARGAVGSSFNFAAPLYLRLIAAFERGELDEARELQHRSTRLISLLARYGYIGAAKATMTMLGVAVGPPRLPNRALLSEQQVKLRSELQGLGFFEWIQ
jgi:N-acetylneuraminate lyase